jgi:hypothetical protein
VDPRNWWPGKKVLVLPRSVKRFDWQHREVQVGLSRERIRQAPAWNGSLALSREDELKVHTHYGLLPYWSGSTEERPGAWP